MFHLYSKCLNGSSAIPIRIVVAMAITERFKYVLRTVTNSLIAKVTVL
jgi:hypothetical protein